ncbi:reverse transcriptase family protein, partial [Pyruvatibacter sp.]
MKTGNLESCKRFTGFEIQVTVSGQPLTAYIDSGSWENYISARTGESLGIRPSGEQRTLVMADGSKSQTLGEAKGVKFRAGKASFVSDFHIFPGMAYDIILGIPWLVSEDPSLCFRTRTVSVRRGRAAINLPLVVSEKPRPTEVMTVGNMTHTSATDIWKDVKAQKCDAVMVVVNEIEAEDTHTKDDLSKLSRPDHSKAISNLLESYRRVFASDLPKGTPPVRNGHEFEIQLEEGTKPIFRPMYKLSPAELTEVKKQLDYMLDRDIIRPSKSPWGAPILFANKKDGGLRFCIDYRWINQRTIKNRYPLPLPEELLDRFHGAKVFSRLDLRSGYWQMPVRAEDQEKTAFRTRYGHYEYKVVPFGLTNAPPPFMAMVNDLFRDFHDQFMVVFLDDIIVYSRTEEEHAEHLRLVLDKLAEHNLFAKASKCAIAVAELDFVGHWITSKGISPHRSKVTAIRDWEPLKSVAEVRSFLGMVSYYRRFIREYS